MLKGIAVIFIGLILSVIAVLMFYTVIKTISIILKSKKGERKTNIRETRYINIIEFIKWVIIDIKRGKDYFKLYGIWCFTGYYGQGKSLGAVNFAFHLKEKYPHKNIKIYSNFNVKCQDGKLEKWEDILNLPKNTIVLFDEIQSTFSSQKWSDFPMELLWKLTQCRKHGLAVFCTSPVYMRMTIQLRESTDFVIECKNRLSMDRWFSYHFYRAPDYERFHEERGLKLRRVRDFTYTLVAQDKNYELYDTVEQIDRWDVMGEEKKKISKNNYNKLKNELIKEIEARMKKVS